MELDVLKGGGTVGWGVEIYVIFVFFYLPLFNNAGSDFRSLLQGMPGSEGNQLYLFLGREIEKKYFSVCSGDADTPDKASVTTTAVEGKGKVNGATATSAGAATTGCCRCAMVAAHKRGREGLYGDI